MTTSVTNASPPTIHGRLLDRAGATAAVRCRVAGRARAADAATGLPHSWQNFEPGDKAALHTPHVASRTTAPHSVQKRPLADAPHAGHGMAAVWLGGSGELMTAGRGGPKYSDRLVSWSQESTVPPVEQRPSDPYATCPRVRDPATSAFLVRCPSLRRCRIHHSPVSRARSCWRS
jgi:hypothetical protein